MISAENNILSDPAGQPKKTSDIPLDHLDYKYVNECENVKELEKIYKKLVSGTEGKYPDLENHVANKIKRLSPESRALRKDAPIATKSAMSKNDRSVLDSEMNDFFNKIGNISQVISKSSKDDDEAEEELPPVRNKAPTHVLPPPTTEKTKPKNSVSTKSNKSPMPRDYNDWAKLEKMLDEDEQNASDDDQSEKKVKAKVVEDKTTINTASKTKHLIKDLPKTAPIKGEIDENIKVLKADQEKCKGNESFKSGCFEEALHYYTRSIQYMPTAASYNNRAMTYLKLEKWEHAIEDCSYVLKYESGNIKALLRRSTAYFKKKRYQDANSDIDRCLSMQENNKKALELKIQISEQIVKEETEKDKVKSKGGKRLQIEESDSDSSDEEDVEEQLEKIILNGKEKPSSIEVKDKVTGQKTSIKISEVDSEDCEDSDEEESMSKTAQVTSDKNNNLIESKSESVVEELATKIEPVKVTDDDKTVNKPPVVTTVSLELPKDIVDFKDKANSQFASGQYSEALEFYTFAINGLKAKKTDNLELDTYYKNTLSILYNNRASCKQKICDFKSSITDCDSGLDLIKLLSNVTHPTEFKSLKVKLMLKKANAYEMTEKFKDAFLEYEELMKVDHTNQNIQRNFNRVRGILKESGEFAKIRANRPKAASNPPVDVETKLVREKPIEIVEKPVGQVNIQEKYSVYKSKGNDYVKKGEYQLAVGFYTECVNLDPSNPIGYLNRSLCYVKLDEADLAIKDCSFVLEKEPSNVKALYRRASANKLKKNYDLVAKDLKMLLSLEPNNQIAANEFKVVNEILTKNPKKVLIKEVDSKKSEPDCTPNKPNKPTQEKTEKKIENKPVKIEEKKKEIKVENPSKPAPKKTVTFNKITNGYEFLQGWNSINPKDIDSYARLLTSMDADNLSVFIGTKLDDEMLNRLIKSIHKLSKEKPAGFDGVVFLKELSKTKRFDVTKLFIDKEYLDLVREVCDCGANKGDVDIVMKAFGV